MCVCLTVQTSLRTVTVFRTQLWQQQLADSLPVLLTNNKESLPGLWVKPRQPESMYGEGFICK